MKKIKNIFIVFICLVSALPTAAFAITGGGGTGSSSGSSSGNSGGGNDSCSDSFWQVGTDDGTSNGGMRFNTAAYRYDLVYKNKNGGREILKTVVVQLPNRIGNITIYRGQQNSSIAIREVKEYVDALNATNTARDGARYVTSGPLADLTNRLINKETIDGIFPDGKLENDELIESYITSANGFAIDEADMRREHDDNPGRYDSYGYRIIVQKLVSFQNGCGGVNSTERWTVMGRKDAAGNTAVKRYLVGNREVAIAPASVQANSDLFTTRDDIGIVNAINEMNIFNSSNGNQIKSRLTGSFANQNNGSGYNILWFSTDVFREYDYSIDAACVNCSATGFSNKAYIIQDTTNWDAIFDSPNSKIANARTYYNKGNGVFCREEYTVKFPDLTSHIKVNTGRYFTVNATNEELSALTTTVPNLKPITVTRTRECRSSNNNVSALTNFERNSRSTFEDNAGTVTLKYTENNKDNSEYSKKSIVLEPDEYADNTYSSNISNNMLTMTQTVSYTLEDNVYRYVRLQDGLSIFGPNGINESELNTEYKDLGIANLPISFENETEGDGKIADVQLSYELPTDPNSKIKNAYKMNNDYFADPSNPTDDNIYKKALDAGAISGNSIVRGSLDDNEYSEITQSACAKLYKNGNGYNTGLYNCVNNRTKNKIGNNNDCIVQNKLDNSNSGYICPVTRDPNDGICRIENGKYYLGDGTEVTAEEYYAVCPADNSCRIENGKYYDFDGNEITEEEYYAICPVTPNCPADECPYGCCPSGECAPMPDGTCPGTGGIDVIYRTIDLNNPFPGQDAEQRNTGANWCSYNIKTQKIDCSYNNRVVQEYVTDEGEDVYDENHILYEVTLDANTIRSIRNYNDDHKYDDWDLVCRDNGRACLSDFLRSEVDTTGECANKVSKDAFYSCDDNLS